MSMQLNPRTNRWRAHHVMFASLLALTSSACSDSTSPGFGATDLRGSLETEDPDASTPDASDPIGEGMAEDGGIAPAPAEPDAGSVEEPPPAEPDAGSLEEPPPAEPDAGSLEEPPPAEPDAGDLGGQLLETTEQSAPLSFDTVTEIAPANLVAASSDYRDSPRFGYPVFVQGNRMLVGAWGDGEQAPDQGAAILYERINGIWTFDTKLMASDATPSSGWGASFGYSAAMDGDTLVMAAPGADGDGGALDAGAVYVYDLTGNSWVETKLLAPNPAAGQYFGDSVTITGDWIFAHGDDVALGNRPAIHVFHRGINGWEFTQEITSPQGTEQRTFGYNIAAGGTALFVSAERAPNHISGWRNWESSVYAYELVEGTWNLVEQILPSGTMPGDFFSMLAFDGTTLVVGAPYSSTGSFVAEGSAYVFTNQGGSWTEVAALHEQTPREAYFGFLVAVDGPTLAIGTSSGLDDAMYVYERSAQTGAWSLSVTTALSPIADAAQAWGVESLSLSNNEMYLGLPDGTSNGNAWGAVYSLTGGGVL